MVKAISIQAYCIVLWMLCSSLHVQCTTFGSDTAVSRLYPQQTFSDGDSVLGFVALQGGFTFDRGTVGNSATWDCFFPVSGPVSFLGDTLTLNRDLMFADPTGIESLGNITGNEHTLALSPTVTLIPNSNDICMQMKFMNEVTPAATVRSLAWSPNNDYVAVGLGGSSLAIYSFDGHVLTSVTSANLDAAILSVSWHPTASYIAVGRAAATEGEFRTFEFASDTLTELTDNAIDFAADVTSVNWHPSGDYIAIGDISGGVGTLGVYSFNTDTGILNTTALDTVTTAEDIADDAVKWNAAGDFIAVGMDQNTANADVEVYEWDAVNSTLTLNASYAEASWWCEGLEWHPTSTGIIIAGGNNTAANSKVLLHDQSAGTLTNQNSFGVNVLTSDIAIAPNGSCVALCYASGGLGNIQIFNFNPDTFATTALLFLTTGATTVYTAQWSPNGKYLAWGTGVPLLTVYQNAATFDSRTDQFTLSNIHVALQADLTIESGWLIFSGETVINGNGNTLTLGDNCQIIVDTDSSLILSNMRINGVRDTNIRCLSSSSTITLQNLCLTLTDTFTFTQGQLDIIDDVVIQGNSHQFAWESDQHLSIAQTSKLILSSELTFSYQPTGLSKTLLQFTDTTSELIMEDGVTMHVSSAGLHLTKGAVRLQGDVIFQGDSSTSGSEIVWGDTMQAASDCLLVVSNGSELYLSEGVLSYQNSTSSAFNFGNTYAHLRIGSGAILQLYNTFSTGVGHIVFENQATLALANGVTLEGSRIPRGSLTYRTI